MINPFTELAVLLVLAVFVAGVMRLLRQPLIISHIITGVIAGPYVFNVVKSHSTLELVSEIGIAILLFIIGLELNPRVIKEVGKISLVTGLGKIATATTLGFLLGLALDFSVTTSLYLGLGVSFSSTIVIMKLLADKKELDQMYGKASIGFLLVEDIVASLILIGVASSSHGTSASSALLSALSKTAVISLIFYLLARAVIPRTAHFLAKSQEMLLLFSIAWALGIAALVQKVGLSLEIGGLLAGVVFAPTYYAREMGTRLKPLRDFFLVIFFILLGSQIILNDLKSVVLPVLAFSTLVIIGNPLVVMFFMRFFGHSKKTNFKAGLAGAQVSEFSLILIVLGAKTGHIEPEIVSLITMTALVTIAVSSYFIIYSDALYNRLEQFLNLFERKGAHREARIKNNAEVFILGYQDGFFESFEHDTLLRESSYIIIDRDPGVIHSLKSNDIDAEYGDVLDLEFLSELRLESAKLIISNITVTATNELVLYHVRNAGFKGIFTVRASSPKAALELYGAGADYAELIDTSSASVAIDLIKKNGLSKASFSKTKRTELAHLKQMR